MKVIKKAPNHIPAHLGYATSFERFAKPNQIAEAAGAYVNATKVALALGENRLAENTYSRALEVMNKMDGKQLEALRYLSDISFTYALSAETYYKIGLELLKRNQTDTKDIEEAIFAFQISSSLAGMDKDNENGVHGKSTFQLGKLALNVNDDVKGALAYFNLAVTEDLGDFMAEVLLLSGQAKEVRYSGSSCVMF